mmetsp:Transcript_27930/g.74178  ORF Transcript_27930/g.74178 Transcript_27930/m.74178 type:complete len:551 (-) Transcript_27930:264-1916(-)
MAKTAWGPKPAEGAPEWSGFSLNVPSINFVLSNNDVYDYKLPYSIPAAPRCARIHPMLYCCDVYCCPCLPKADKLTFMDVVDQHTGHQVRYRAKKKCCFVPRILTFLDGQYIGYVARTMRCFNRCLTCCEDFRSKPVLQLGLHDKDGNQLARIDRNGKGGCLWCKCGFPMKCTGCCFTCCTWSCLVRPSMSMPLAGCLDCDPVCCECCVRGDRTCCSVFDQPCCCIGLPLAACSCWWCTPGCEIKHFENVSTIKFQDFDVLDAKSKEPVGLLQSQFRGNYPSMYTHNQDIAFKVNGNTTNGLLGTLLSAVATGMTYPMGDAEPTFAGLKAQPQGTSPGYSGFVECDWAPQMKLLLGLDGGKAKLREDLIVGDDMVFGTRVNGTQVKGWLLTEIGWNADGLGCCGISCLGKQKKPRCVSTRKEVEDIVKVALEDQVGDKGTTFIMRFRLPDQEKQIIKKGDNTFGDVNLLDSKFNPPGGGFIDQMEEVDCTINCIRCCKFPCKFTHDKIICCRCPCYARVVNSAKAHPSKWEEPPPVVIMVNAPKKAFGEP